MTFKITITYLLPSRKSNILKYENITDQNNEEETKIK